MVASRVVKTRSFHVTIRLIKGISPAQIGEFHTIGSKNVMSKDLQEKSDKIIKELKDYLLPISEEIKKLKHSDTQND